MSLLDNIQNQVKVQPKKDRIESSTSEQTGSTTFQLKVGKTTTGLPGTPANVSVTGSQFQPTLNFVIPEGVQGDTGIPGPSGSSINLLGELNDVSELPEDASQGDAYTIDGELWIWTDDGDGAWNNAGQFRGPQGEQGVPGAAATIGLGTVSTGSPGSNVSITNSGNSSSAIFNFTIPRGDQGEQGPAGPSVWGGISGNIATQTDLITLFNSKADNTAVVFNTGNQTITGVKEFNALQIALKASTTSASYICRDSSNVNQFSLFWNSGTDLVTLRRYNAAGNAAEGELVLTSTNLTWNGSNVWHAGNLDPTTLASNSSVVLLTTNQTVAGEKTFSNNVTVNSGNIFVDAVASQNAAVFIRNETDVNQGSVFWDRSADTFIFRRYNSAGSSAEGEMVVSSTGFSFSSNVSVSGSLTSIKQLRVDRGVASTDSTDDISIGNGTHDLKIHARLTAASQNGLVAADDKAIIFTNGTGNTGGLTIGGSGGSSFGLRLDSNGTHTVGGVLVLKAHSGGAIRMQTSTNTNSFDIGTGTANTDDPEAFIANRAVGGIGFYTNSTGRGKIEANGHVTWYNQISANGSLSGSAFTPTDANVVRSAIKTTGAWGGGIVMVDGTGYVSQYVQTTGTQFVIAFGSSSGTTPKFVLNSIGDLTVSGRSIAASHFNSTTNAAVLGSQAGGTIYIRPEGPDSSTSESRFNSNGLYLHSWLRSVVSGTGWYHEVHGGGWYMSDSTYIRNYGSKPLLISVSGTLSTRWESPSPTLEFYDTDENYTSWIHLNGGQHGFLQHNNFAWAAYRTSGNDWGCVGNVIAYASDQRLKKNISDVPYELISDFFDKIRIRKYDWDEYQIKLNNIGFQPKKDQVGGIAQEFMNVWPDMVVVNEAHNPLPTKQNPNPEKPDFLTIDWIKSVPLIIAEVQALRARVKDLENKNGSI